MRYNIAEILREHILISDNIKDSINDQEVLTNCFSGQFTSIIGFTREIYYFLGESPSLEAWGASFFSH